MSGSSGPVRPPAVLKRQLGTALKGFRKAVDLSIDAVAQKASVSPSSISRIETGIYLMTRRDFMFLLSTYQELLRKLGRGDMLTDEIRADLIALRQEIAGMRGWWSRFGASPPDWLKEYVQLEMGAERVRLFQMSIPGLFQTEEYAYAVISQADYPPQDVNGLVNLRLTRQQHMVESSLRVEAVIDEGALRRRVRSAAVMQAQMKRLSELADLPSIDLRVLPFESGLPVAAAGGPFTILDFEDAPPAVYLETPHTGHHDGGAQIVARYTEMFGRLMAVAYSRHETTKVLTEASDAFR